MEFEPYETPRTGGSLSSRGFDCRYCSCMIDTSHHGVGARIMYAAYEAADHMRAVHAMTMDGKPLDILPVPVPAPVQLDIFDLLGAAA